VTVDVTVVEDAPHPPAPVAVAEPEPVNVAAPVSEEAPPVAAPVASGRVDPTVAPADGKTVADVLPRPGSASQPLGPPGFASMFAKREPRNRRERRAAAKAAHRSVKK